MKDHILKFSALFEGINEPGYSTITLNSPYIDTYDVPTIGPNDEPSEFPKETLDRLRKLGILKGPEVESVDVNQATIKYTITPVFNRYGIEGIDLTVKEIILHVEYETYHADSDDTQWDEIEIIDNSPDLQSRCSIGEINKLPFIPTNIEVKLGSSWDKSKFTYEFEIGDR